MLDASSIMEKSRFIVLARYPRHSKLFVTRTQENPEAAGKYPLLTGVII